MNDVHLDLASLDIRRIHDIHDLHDIHDIHDIHGIHGLHAVPPTVNASMRRVG